MLKRRKHVRYTIKPTPGLLDSPDGQQLYAARMHAGHTHFQVAEFLGLSDPARISEYENNRRRMPGWRFTLYMLFTGQHPDLMLVKKRGPKDAML